MTQDDTKTARMMDQTKKCIAQSNSTDYLIIRVEI